jgi:MoaD family protein
MPVQVRLPHALADLTGGERQTSVEAGAAGAEPTVSGLVAVLDARYPGAAARLLDESGLRRYVNVYVNGRDVRLGAGLATPLHEGDAVWILPSSSGGMPASLGMWPSSRQESSA